LLAFFRAPPETPLHRGAVKPTGVEHFDEKAAETIHGKSGSVSLSPSLLFLAQQAGPYLAFFSLALTSPSNCYLSLSLDGVELLPPTSDPAVQHFYTKTPSGSDTAVEAMTSAIRTAWDSGKGDKTWVVVTGPCTNAAKLIQQEEDLVKEAVAGWVVMGGAFGSSFLRCLLAFDRVQFEFQTLITPHPMLTLLSLF
jgi:hypothetical protein